MTIHCQYCGREYDDESEGEVDVVTRHEDGQHEAEVCVWCDPPAECCDRALINFETRDRLGGTGETLEAACRDCGKRYFVGAASNGATVTVRGPSAEEQLRVELDRWEELIASDRELRAALSHKATDPDTPPA